MWGVLWQCTYIRLSHVNAILSQSGILYYSDVITGTVASQITSLTIVYSTVSFRRRSKKIFKLRVTGLCAENSPGTGEFPAQMSSNAENVSIWWHHHDLNKCVKTCMYYTWFKVHPCKSYQSGVVLAKIYLWIEPIPDWIDSHSWKTKLWYNPYCDYINFGPFDLYFFYWVWSTEELFHAWFLWNVIIHVILKFRWGLTEPPLKFRVWLSNYIPCVCVDVITCPCRHLSTG